MIGRRLAHFRITGELGEGGMGRVYRAEDTKLGREVAIKVLPEAFVADPERLARFEREAKLLASLNHPNVAGIFETGTAPFGEVDGDASSSGPGASVLDELGGRDHDLHFLVMELAPGETLADRLSRGPIPLAQALPIAIQIASALEAAHANGIIHRDLKPANVTVTASGDVKVLDFGLARALDTPGGGSGNAVLSHSPTLTAQMTGAGVILGTAAYMSPEQAKGEEADRRADVWSFGVVLAEMLTGEKTFGDATVSETLASVLKSDPDLGRLPVSVPPSVRRLLDRCLRKDPSERLRDIADARLVLEDVLEGRMDELSEVPGRSRGATLGLVGLGVAVGVALASVAMLLLPKSADEVATSSPPPRSWVLEHGNMGSSRPNIAPDGHRVAFAEDGQIWIRDLRRLETLPVAGTAGAVVPFWSPDGEWLGFTAQGSLQKIRLDGSGRTVICPSRLNDMAGGAVWVGETIYFVEGSSPLFSVSARGGEPNIFVPLGEDEADFHNIAALPDGRLLTTVHRGDIFDNIQLIGTDGSREEILTIAGTSISEVTYSPTGHILFVRWPISGLWAVPFSVATGRVEGEPFPVTPSGLSPTVSHDGTLVHGTTTSDVANEIVVVDRSGVIVGRFGEPRPGIDPGISLSPDGRRVVAPVLGAQSWDLWAFDADGSAPRRLTFGEIARTASPAWSPDGSRLYYAAWRRSDDFRLERMNPAVGGDGETVIEGGFRPEFTKDGRTMVYNARAPGFNWDLWMRAVDGEDPGTPLLTADGWELHPALSPDDRYLAYDHEDQVFVRRFPSMEGPWQIGDGVAPKWSPDGSRLYFLNGRDLMEARIAIGDEVRVEAPVRLFTFDLAPTPQDEWPAFGVMPDGEGFVLVRTTAPPPGLVVMQSWLDGLQ